MHICYSVSNMKSGAALIYFLGEISLIWKIAEAYENLALRKPTWQQHWYTYKYSYPPDKAVDGEFSNRSPYGGQCTVSGNNKRTATWRVDLGTVLNIHHITIYYRTDNLPWGPDNGYPSRFLGFSLFISNTTNKDDGYLCFKDTNYTRETIPSNITIECVKHGRYVIYYNERLPGVTYPEGYSPYAYNELCEVQVYGCPSFDIYGENCTFPCPQTCREERCNIVDGTCFGCIAGQKGSRCEQCTDIQAIPEKMVLFCDGGKFGLNCAQSCGFCFGNEQCHPINGSCLNGCDKGYHKDRCKKENLALYKSTWQDNSYSAYYWRIRSFNAVDGEFSDRSLNGGQCVISGRQKQTATWWVNLSRIVSIHHVTIYYRTENLPWGKSNGYTSRFLGFSVYISNTTNKDEGFLCFKDTHYTIETIPDNITIECIRHGRYVIYYNERLPGVTYPEGYSTYAFNELCELEVYGCSKSGEYGENCTLPCPGNCQEGHCNIEDGTCLGCVVGYKGLHCEEECDNNKYGFECNLTCGNCSKGEQCNHVNGSCSNGCDEGVQGDMCVEQCPEGYYGYNCEDTCSINCGVHSRCNRVTGECQDGCQAGWEGLKCDKQCDVGSFGQNCTQSCGIQNCFRNEQCHHINGTCLNGCNKGYQGDTCTQVCPNRRYGYNCEETCTNCSFVRRCDTIEGKCNVIKESLDSDTTDGNLYLVYGMISSLCLSVVFNVVLIIWSCRWKTCKGKNQQAKITTPIPRKLSTQIKVQERVVHAYDDLDEREKSTKPSKLKTQIKDEAEESAVYEDLDQIEISTQPSKLKTQIKDGVEDGVVYEEPDQTSQQSIYENYI
ncbi:multiple epidermal growth factor-like domains protein 10 [Saccostrea cucullata]|uniref:multiple epidermal growth factor-like domains protein 10 n=1 Tax=Saccostrea cuccullata TaxID=36930 RepID=UPI002ED001D0